MLPLDHLQRDAKVAEKGHERIVKQDEGLPMSGLSLPALLARSGNIPVC